MNRPYCEICGEQHASMKMQDVAVCDDCFADECRNALWPILGKRCCNLSIHPRNGEPQICLAVYGVEHDHC